MVDLQRADVGGDEVVDEAGRRVQRRQDEDAGDHGRGRRQAECEPSEAGDVPREPVAASHRCGSARLVPQRLVPQRRGHSLPERRRGRLADTRRREAGPQRPQIPEMRGTGRAGPDVGIAGGGVGGVEFAVDVGAEQFVVAGTDVVGAHGQTSRFGRAPAHST
ncbi:hypothetical protein GCM10007904_28900 [Oharaeibacter diazotrophicus]|nr:hypothetical protein GCM10007904_28900 [Oharaeibacter diazotrophicus]